jgi:phospholipase/lecithinase/hemolysin
VLPERDVEETVKRLTPLLNDPNLDKKIDEAAGNAKPASQANMMANDADVLGDNMMDDGNDRRMKEKINKKNTGKTTSISGLQTTVGNNSMLAQVVGIIIGSPEFQRR